MPSTKPVICSVVQNGIYEKEALMLGKSIRRWHGQTEVDVFMLYPGGGLAPSAQTLEALSSLGVRTVEYPETSASAITPVARKLAAMEHFEQGCLSGAQRTVWLDTDTICVQSIEELLLAAPRISLCPVRRRNVGLRENEPLNDYWAAILEASGCASKKPWSVRTTREHIAIRPYFNTGVLGYPGGMKLFSRASEVLCKLHRDGAMAGWTKDQMYFSEQAVLSQLVIGEGDRSRVEILDVKWNCPWMPFLDLSVKDVRILHHHHAASRCLDDLSGRILALNAMVA